MISRRLWNRNLMASFFPNISNSFRHRDINEDWRMEIAFPPVNVKKADEIFKVCMAIPGMNKEDLNIEIKHGELIVSGETKQETKKETKEYLHKEFEYHSFKRSFHLPVNIHVDAIESTYENGILTIYLPEKVTSTNNKKSLKVTE